MGNGNVAFVADRDKVTQLYINGGLNAKGNPTEETNATTESALFVGALVRKGKQTRRYFERVIDEVAVYRRALSAAEVKKNKSAKGLAVKPGGKLALVWEDVKLDC